jgi:hypothetical protein
MFDKRYFWLLIFKIKNCLQKFRFRLVPHPDWAKLKSIWIQKPGHYMHILNNFYLRIKQELRAPQNFPERAECGAVPHSSFIQCWYRPKRPSTYQRFSATCSPPHNDWSHAPHHTWCHTHVCFLHMSFCHTCAPLSPFLNTHTYAVYNTVIV